jgi:hypothetical protein
MERPTVEKILDDAAVHATYLRGLLTEGVSLPAALQLTSSYIIALRMPDQAPPKAPWEEK